jgi:sulfide:quinone oxidoreductase
VNATGPKLAFDLTEGMNPGTNKCYSVCSYDHAEHASAAFTNLKLKLKNLREKLKFLLGLGIQKRLAKVQLSNIF